MSDEDTPTDEEIIANLTQKLEAIKEQLQNYEYFWKCFLHDIRAPAGMIVGSLNLLKNEYSTETSDKQATIIDIAWRGAQRLNNHQKFYSEILSLLHSNAGEFRPEKVKLISVLEEHKVLEIHSTHSLPLVHGDVHLIHRALSNFLTVLSVHDDVTVNCHTKVENSRVFVQLTKPRFNYSIYWQEEFNQSLEAKLKQKQLHMITPIDIGKALIEKQGGQVTIEKFGESGIAITFTLPIYKEKTPPPT